MSQPWSSGTAYLVGLAEGAALAVFVNDVPRRLARRIAAMVRIARLRGACRLVFDSVSQGAPFCHPRSSAVAAYAHALFSRASTEDELRAAMLGTVGCLQSQLPTAAVELPRVPSARPN